MTTDLRRLCEAAERASARDDIELTGTEVEAMVRAVLTELREVSVNMAAAGGTEEVSTLRGTDYVYLPIGDWSAQKSFTAMINNILAEPGTA